MVAVAQKLDGHQPADGRWQVIAFASLVFVGFFCWLVGCCGSRLVFCWVFFGAGFLWGGGE